MKIAITGGCGGIGTNICSYLLSRDYEVISFDNLSSRYSDTNILRHKRYKFVHGDARIKDDVSKIDADYVIHLAEDDNYRNNITGDLNIIEHCSNKKIPLIFCSSNKVYSNLVNSIPKTELDSRYTIGKKTDQFNQKGKPIIEAGKFGEGIKETFPMDGFGEYYRSLYGASKYVGDLFSQEFNKVKKSKVIILRLSYIYGKYQYNDWLADIMIKKILGGEVEGGGKEVTDALYADDFSELILKLISDFDVHNGKVYNIGGGSSPSFNISRLEAINLVDVLDQRAGYKHGLVKIKNKKEDFDVYISDLSKISPYWKPKTIVFMGFEIKFKWILQNIDLIKERI